MGQDEVYDWFKRMAKTGDRCWFNMIDIIKGLDGSGVRLTPVSIRRSVAKLERYGYLELNINKGWFRYWRIKKKYCNGVSNGAYGNSKTQDVKMSRH